MVVNNQEPALNEISAPFLYMINNDFIEIVEDITTEKIVHDLNNHRIKSLAKSYDLFTTSNISKIPDSENEVNFIFYQLPEGHLYSVDINTYHTITNGVSSLELYNHILFLDVTRNGMRLIIPIYKLFHIEDKYLLFNAVGVSFLSKLELESDDKFLVASGDNLRSTIRKLRKNVRFKKQVSLGHAGVYDKFSSDQI